MTDPLRVKTLALLAPIQRKVERCNKCKLALTRKHTVFGKGNPLARLVVLGEGPGDDEDKQGIPFVGKAGRLLQRGLEAIGYSEANTYFCNIVKCRACEVQSSGWAKNRTPDSEEVGACAPYLHRQLDALPHKKLVLAVGSTAMHWLLQADPGTIRIGSVRGKFLNTSWMAVVGLATYHPSYLLREENAETKAAVYEDFKLARDYLAGRKGDFADLDLKTKDSFLHQKWAEEEPLQVLPSVEEERKRLMARVGKLLPSQQDKYTTVIEIAGAGPVEKVEPVGRPVFAPQVKVPKKRKAAELPLLGDDDVPF